MNYEKKLKPYISLVNEIPSQARNKIIKIALAILQSTNQDRTNVLEKLSNEYNIEKFKLTEIIATYIELTKLLLTTNDREYNEILSQLGFSTSFIEEISFVKEVTNTILKSKKIENRHLTSLNWRIDISLYNELLNKNARTVIIQINLRDGKKCTIEADVKTFHKLRYSTALILKELISVKNALP